MSMDPTHMPSSEASNSEPVLKRNSDDVGWEYGVIVDVKNKDRLRCILCGNQYTGGVSRMKKHIAQVRGDVAACTKASKEDILKCKKALDETAAKKKEKKQGGINLREEVNIVREEGDEFEDDEVEHVGSRKRPHVLGPLDRYAEINPGSSDTTTSGFKKVKQPNIKDAIWKKRSHEVSQYLARWVYEAGIPFHAIDNDSFKRFVEAVGQFGPGYEPPSQYQLREPLLKEEVDRTKKLLKRQEEEWALTGCSIMTDAWTDRKRRSIMNLCVNCKQGTCFLSSKEDSEASHTGVYIFEYVDKFIEDIGAQNVVQVVTDNASNNMAAAELLKIKRPNIFWTSCGTHTINLMLEGIAFLTLQSLMEKKQELWAMFSEAWDKMFGPLVMVLRLVDGDRKPSMGFVYGELKNAKEEIKGAYKLVETNYWPILDVIDGKAKGRLDTFFSDDVNVQDEVINRELLKYKNKEGGFGRPLATIGCATNNDSYDPVGWWSNYGNHTPNLKRMATRILSLTSSSSGCERNWSTFEGIHTKKRNRLDATRLNNLVYVQFNAKLINNKRKGKDVLRASEATHAQGWIVEGGNVDEENPVSGLTWEMIGEATGAEEALHPRRSTRNVGVRELHEEDFLSEDDPEVEDMAFLKLLSTAVFLGPISTTYHLNCDPAGDLSAQ
ncbi:hypothetical protein RHSIM_Rhsim01G0126200 [Rhododendron simsii]|uniref:BED-type domain-containing protein n=1 Tax=Rhododendron simsii TaxID=118357 RepID=A0A834HHB1_RHOSS|nr:hypothetical protein RHSIM_Rhsim01G0126200 [Rhododendron simsii]